MNVFLSFERDLRVLLADRADVDISVDRPCDDAGIWILSLAGREGFTIEIEWSRYRGFGLAAGWDLQFGVGVDEIFATPDATVQRIVGLLNSPEATSVEKAVDLSELRRLQGVLQKDVADRLGITKSGLAQLERPAALKSMQIGTLQRFASGLGGELIISVKFPHGRKRKIAV